MPDYEVNEGYIRSRFRDINGAFAKYVSLAPVRPLGHQQYTVSTTVTTITPPSGTKRMHLRSVGQPINFRDDGVNPSDISGFPIMADEWLLYDSEVVDFRMIRAASATNDADVRCAFYA